MAGHSHWANIKHKKAKLDARRGKVWSKCARAIIVAAKNGGGDPDMNVTLRYAVEDAKAANMPKDTIENAIRKGTGELGGQNFERLTYEGYGPGGVAIMLDILTDNRNRTAPELRIIFSKNGGNLASAGSVAYLFTPRGQVFIPAAAGDEDTIMAAALEAGAEDVEPIEDSWQVTTEPAQLIAIRDLLEKSGLPIESAEITMVPGNTVSVAGDDAERVLKLIDALEDHDDVQKVYANFEMPEDTLAALEK
jgi:YebC/PmpR family DNA-binding regulatory protein